MSEFPFRPRFHKDDWITPPPKFIQPKTERVARRVTEGEPTESVRRFFFFCDGTRCWFF